MMDDLIGRSYYAVDGLLKDLRGKELNAKERALLEKAHVHRQRLANYLIPPEVIAEKIQQEREEFRAYVDQEKKKRARTSSKFKLRYILDWSIVACILYFVWKYAT